MKTIIAILLFPVAALFAGDQSGAITVTEQSAFTFYKPFKRLTKQPQYVAPLTAVLCSLPSPASLEQEKAATGPHYHAYVHIYANPLAVDAATQKLEAYPAGAVIVKEKLAADGSVAAVGGMIKRDSGFDAGNGDWEYFFAAKAGGFSAGRLENCIDCHGQAKATDYVYSVRKLVK